MIKTSAFPQSRPRRLRSTPSMRKFVRENHVRRDDLVLPLFVKAGISEKRPITSMPGHFQLTLDDLESETRKIKALGIGAIMLFGIPEHKDTLGSGACVDDGIVQRSIGTIKDIAPDLLVISDICFCEYMSHGHCGVIHETPAGWDVDNDQTLELLQRQVESHARAGADIIAPSGMIDGMVQAIRQALDESGYSSLPILSYAVKYASAMYGPFREAAEGAPAFGDRTTYQMDVANGDEALKEATLDVQEGADMLMVKPGHTYLDIVWRVKNAYPEIPLGAYHPSGEFAMIKAAAEKGWINESQAVIEVLTSMKRAGADFIVTYYAKEFCQWRDD